MWKTSASSAMLHLGCFGWKHVAVWSRPEPELLSVFPLSVFLCFIFCYILINFFLCAFRRIYGSAQSNCTLKTPQMGCKSTLKVFFSGAFSLHRIYHSWLSSDSADTHCPRRSGTWPPCPPSSPRDWPARDGRGHCGRVADHAGWSVMRCAPRPGTRARWCCGRRHRPPWCSGSTGTLSRCGSVSGWMPNSPTAGTTAWIGRQWRRGPATAAWVLRDKELEKERHTDEVLETL